MKDKFWGFLTFILIFGIILGSISVSALSKMGSRGTEVKNIQTRLKKWGYYSGSIDGIYGTETKNAVIKFQKSNGLTADGSKLDPYEITDPYVVSKALALLDMGGANATDFAQRIWVTPVISAAEQEKYASWLDNFSDYEKTEEGKSTPIFYRIEFESNEGVQFAKDFLNALIHQYRNYYTEKYVGLAQIAIIPESVVLNADYYSAVELLQEQMEDLVQKLDNIAQGDTDYRSPVTGYSMKDLIDEYILLMETKNAPTMQYILEMGISKDVSTLVAGLQQSADKAQRDSDENAEKAVTQEELMLLYAEKNKEYVSTVIEQDDYEDQVYGDVERDRAYLHIMTTYDQMMLDYVDYAVKSGDLLIDKAYINERLEKFGNSTGNAKAPTEAIADIYSQYASLTKITEETLEGYNAYKSGRVILQASGIRVTENLPELLFYTVSFIFAFCLGCGLILIDELKKWNEKHGAKQATASERVL